MVVNLVNRFAWAPLSAALLLGVPLAEAQTVRPDPAGPSVSGGSCVVAGPSYGDCSALGRYAQGYRDVEGGLSEAGPAAARQAVSTGEPLHAEAAMSPGAGQARRTRAP
jgi:hypothetical protein